MCKLDSCDCSPRLRLGGRAGGKPSSLVNTVMHYLFPIRNAKLGSSDTKIREKLNYFFFFFHRYLHLLERNLVSGIRYGITPAASQNVRLLLQVSERR